MNNTEPEQGLNHEESIPSMPQSEIFKRKKSIQSHHTKRTLNDDQLQSTIFTKKQVVQQQCPIPEDMIQIRDRLINEQFKAPYKSIKLEDAQHFYQGSVILGVKCGFGRMYDKKKKFYYEGQFMANKRNGQGLFINQKGEHYIGEFINDEPVPNIELVHDHEIQYPNKAYYLGEVQNGKRNGIGSYYWADGTFYLGQFKNDQFEGFGIMKYADGRTYQGLWKQGMMNGMGHFSWPDGRDYEGEYSNNKKNGFGVFKWQNGLTYLGFFENGKQHGLAILRQSESQSTLTTWVEGKKQS